MESSGGVAKMSGILRHLGVQPILASSWARPLSLYAKSMFEKFARRCSRQQEQMTFLDVVFLGI